MHALLAHMYHLAQYAIHIATRPVWQPLGACLGVAAAGRLSRLTRRLGGAALVAGAAVMAGWLVEAPPMTWPLSPVARLSGLAALLWVDGALQARDGRPWRLAVTAALGAWWMRGAPFSGPGFLGCVPVALGFGALLAVVSRLGRGDRGWAALIAAAGLVVGLLVSGASPHWARQAGVPAVAALGLFGVVEAMPVLAGLIVAVSVSALVASDRGRLVPVDCACLLPLLVWLTVPWGARIGQRR